MNARLHLRLRAAAARLGDAPVRLDQLAELHGAAAEGTLLVLLATPCALPVPGIGNVLGIALMVVAAAMWRGEGCTALPQRVAELVLSAHWARRVLLLLAAFYACAGRWSAPRCGHLAVHGARSWLAWLVGLMAVLIFLPIPFGNLLPAVSLVLLGIGLVFRDGLAVLLAAVVGFVAFAYGVGVGIALWVWGLTPLLDWLWGVAHLLGG